MEDNNNQTVEQVDETKVCKVCGRELPLEEFPTYGKGYKATCKCCLRQKNKRSAKFENISSRELIAELRLRGYKGKLTYVSYTEVVI